MADRKEHARLFATFLNNAASGSLLGFIVTLPLAAYGSGLISPFQQASLELVFCGVAIILAGIAQLVLWRYG